MTTSTRSKKIEHTKLYRRAIMDAFIKLDPRSMARNPVMFVVEIGAIFTTLLSINTWYEGDDPTAGYISAITIWLWFTVIFANFSEALAEGRGKAQAESLRATRSHTNARRLRRENNHPAFDIVPAADLRKGDLFRVEAGEFLPADGEVIEGIAAVDESAVTGESAPVIRESGGDRSAVTGGTRLLSDWLVIQVTANPGESFLDRMISMVESSKRKKTPNELALHTLLTSFTILFLVVTGTLLPFSLYSVHASGVGTPVTLVVLVALLVCLIPTTIGGLLSAIGIAGMDRLLQKNVIAFSGRAVEAAGDVDVLLLDKTGTITLGNRQAIEIITVDGASPQEVAEAAQLASLPDETPEGRSIVILVKEKFHLHGQPLGDSQTIKDLRFIPFSAQTRMSGVDFSKAGEKVRIRKGAPDSMIEMIKSGGNTLPLNLGLVVDKIARSGGTPLVLAKNERAIGAIHLKDIIKGGIKERFTQLRKIGIKTIMITGDNPLTAAAIAAEAGVDDLPCPGYTRSKAWLDSKIPVEWFSRSYDR